MVRVQATSVLGNSGKVSINVGKLSNLCLLLTLHCKNAMFVAIEVVKILISHSIVYQARFSEPVTPSILQCVIIYL